MRKAFFYLIFFLFIIALNSCKRPHEFNDTITLNSHDKNPYGTYAAFTLLSKEFPHAVIQTNKYAPGQWKNLTSDSSKQVLLIVTKTFYPSEQELSYLTGFVQQGNYVFVSALKMSEDATKFFKLSTKKQFGYYDLMLNVHHPFDPFDSIVIHLDKNNFVTPLSYEYPGADFANEFSNTDSDFTFPLGYSSAKNQNLVAINSIKGTIFLHTAPMAFTNFFLLYENNRQYFEKLMSLLPSDARKIVWDDYYLYYDQNNHSENSGVLSVILKYENFRWAFWVVLLLLLLYIVTEIKRKQRIIPKYEKPKNDSLEFVTTIGKLYYEKADHKNLAEKLSQYFLDYVRNHFKISTAEINSSFEEQLAAKSNKDVLEIRKITDNMHTINLSNAITQKQLMNYYELLENFYKTT